MMTHSAKTKSSGTRNTTIALPNEVRFKKPFGDNSKRNIEALLGEDSDDNGPGELGKAFLQARTAVPSGESVIDVPGGGTKITTDALPPTPLSKAQFKFEPNQTPSLRNFNKYEFAQHVMLHTSLIVENPKLQPRLRIDEAHVNELAHSIRDYGQLDAILVRALPDGKYEVIAGAHRLRAILQLNRLEIKASILDVSFDEARKLAVISNEIRSDTSDYEKALSYFNLLEDKVVTNQAELGDLVGLHQSRISQCLAFISLPQEIKEILNDHPKLFGYRSAVELKRLINEKSKDKETTPQNVVEVVKLGVQRLVDGAPLTSLQQWIQQRLSSEKSFDLKEEPRIVLDSSGRTVFTTKGKDGAITIKWDKKVPFTTQEVQDALMQALNFLTKSKVEEI